MIKRCCFGFHLSLLLLITLVGSATGEDILDCRQIAASTDDASAPIAISDLHLTTNHESSGLQFDALNMGTKPVTGILMIIELQDTRGNNMLSIPVYTLDAISVKPLDMSLGPWLRVHDELKLMTGILPGSKLTIVGWSPAILTKCPSAAKAYLLDLETADGSIVRNKTLGWQIDPVLTEANYIKPSFSRGRPVRLSATIGVDPQGKGSVERTDAVGQVDMWLRTIVKSWKFSPAIEDGRSRQGEVSILLRVDEDAKSYAEPFWFQSGQEPTTVILVRITASDSENSIVFEGGKDISRGKRRSR